MRGLNPVRLGNEVEGWYLSMQGLNPVRLGKEVEGWYGSVGILPAALECL